MIPKFPQFKSLELEDKKEIEEFNNKFLPYSDFNFISMWSWDTKKEMLLSVLNDNLIVRFTDYINGKPFYSFLGNNKINETTKTLLELSKKEGLEQKLRLIPKEVADNLDKSIFDLVSEQNEQDYIYSVSELSNMDKWAQNSSGKNIRKYRRSCPNYIVKNFSIKKAKKDEYLEVFKKWAINKETKNYSKLNEYEALERIFKTKEEKLNIVSIYVNNILVGFTIYEILPSNYVISHFAKTNIKHHCAISDILNWEEAKIINEQGVNYFNWEQDLGILGLRKSKEKFKPVFYLKKFSVTYKKQN